MTKVLTRNDITPEQRAKLARLARCRFLPGSWDKRFVRDLQGLAVDCEAADEVPQITLAQAEQIDRLYHRYRRQINPKR